MTRPVLDELHQRMRDLFLAKLQYIVSNGISSHDESPELKTMGEQIDDVLNQCAGIEYCEQCSDIFCPFGELLHFHHDGCPCCSFVEPWPHEKMDMELLQRNTVLFD